MTKNQLQVAIAMKKDRRPFRHIADVVGLSYRTVRKHYRRWKADRSYLEALA